MDLFNLGSLLNQAPSTPDGTAAGASGLAGFFRGPAAYGDSGLTGTVSANGSGLSGVMAGGLGDSLGSSPTGVFSGLLPGGGMSSTSSGALGGGLSGDAAGSSTLGGASMGAYDPSLVASVAQQLLAQQSQASQQRADQAKSQQPVGSNFANPQAILYPPAMQTPPVNSRFLGQVLMSRGLNTSGAY